MARISQSKRRKVAPKVKIKLNKPLKGPLKTAYLPAVRQHERDLVESERKYRELVELAHEGITTVDAFDNLTFVNQQFAKSLGYKVEEVIVGKDELFPSLEDADPHKFTDYIHMCAARNTHGVPLEAIERMARKFQE